MATTTIKSLVNQAKPDIENKYFFVVSDSDGMNNIYAGNHIYKVEKDVGYSVFPMKVSESAGGLVSDALPVVYTDGSDHLYYVDNEIKFPIDQPGIAKKTIASTSTEELEIVKGFLAYVDGAFNYGDYEVFVNDAPELVDSITNDKDTTTTTTTVAPTTTTTTVNP